MEEEVLSLYLSQFIPSSFQISLSLLLCSILLKYTCICNKCLNISRVLSRELVLHVLQVPYLYCDLMSFHSFTTISLLFHCFHCERIDITTRHAVNRGLIYLSNKGLQNNLPLLCRVILFCTVSVPPLLVIVILHLS
jgi:hypothetical protein